MIHDAQYDFYGKRLATCSGDGTINVADLSKSDNNITRINALEKLDNNKNTNIVSPIWKLAWAHPRFGSVLASASFDKTVSIYQETSQQNQQSTWVRVYSKAFDGSINYLQFCPWECGFHLACASSSGKVWLIS